MAGREPEETVDRPVHRQDWRTFTFLHWAFDPAALRPLLPPPLVPDTWDGRAWVGLTPFRVSGARPPATPAVLGLSFPETNLRTYVRLPDGRDAVWFLSLDAGSAVTVLGGRLGVGIPYHLASMAVDEERGTVRYRSRRRSPRPARHDIVVRPGAPFPPDEVGPFDHWLTGRWRALARPFGRLVLVPVRHEPWPLQRVEVERVDEDVFRAAGLVRPDEPPVAHHSSGVDAHLGPPQAAPAPQGP